LGFPALISPTHDFERWSIPPPNGLDPIIPCDEPDDEEVLQFFPAPRAAAPPPAPPTIVAAVPNDDPVILPTRSRYDPDRRFWMFLSVVIAIAIASAVAWRLAL
jgi:hypothetical protein